LCIRLDYSLDHEAIRRPAARPGRAERCARQLTDEILFGALEHGGTVTIGVGDDCLTFVSEARQP
jgi:hypothetical protein